MTKTEDVLRKNGIYNPSMLMKRLGSGSLGLLEWDLMISWRAEQSGRMYRSAGWQVYSPTFKTDPSAHWTENGTKMFKFYSVSKEEALKQAKDWTEQEFGLPADSWVKIPGMGRDLYQPGVLAYVKKLLKDDKEVI